MHQCLFVIISVSLRRRDQEYYGKKGQWTTVQCSFLFIKETNTHKICWSRAWDTAKDYGTDVSGVVKWDWFPQSSWVPLPFLSFPRWFYWWARLVDGYISHVACVVMLSCFRHFQTINRNISGAYWVWRFALTGCPIPEARASWQGETTNGTRMSSSAMAFYRYIILPYNWKKDGSGCRNLLSHKSQLARQVARRIACDVLDSLTREDLASLSFYFQCKVNCPKILPCCSVWQEMQFCHADSSAAGSSEETEAILDERIVHTLQALQFFPWQDTPPMQEEPVGQADEVRFCPAEH